MAEIDQAQEIIKKEQEKAALQLLAGLTDLQDSLELKACESLEVEEAEKEASRYIADALIGISDGNPALVIARPRSIRDEDRRKILPGQHAGVFMQLCLGDGTVLNINFWGGLRTLATSDLHDHDMTLANSHTRRTEAVLSQSVQLNCQIMFPGGPMIDSWTVYNPDYGGSFRQDGLKIDGENIDCHPTLTKNDPNFAKIRDQITEPIKKLTELVPSSV